MTTVEACAKEARDAAALTAAQSADILDFLKTARRWRKHARTACGFLIGLLSAAGIGNPAVVHYLGSVFGTH